MPHFLLYAPRRCRFRTPMRGFGGPVQPLCAALRCYCRPVCVNTHTHALLTGPGGLAVVVFSFVYLFYLKRGHTSSWLWIRDCLCADRFYLTSEHRAATHPQPPHVHTHITHTDSHKTTQQVERNTLSVVTQL